MNTVANWFLFVATKFLLYDFCINQVPACRCSPVSHSNMSLPSSILPRAVIYDSISPMAQALGSQVAKNGQHIFIYNNIRTNQVVYSLTRSLNVTFPPSPSSTSINPFSRTMTQSNNFLSSAKRPSPRASAKISGYRWP